MLQKASIFACRRTTVGFAGMSVTRFAGFVGMSVTRFALSDVAEHMHFDVQVYN